MQQAVDLSRYGLGEGAGYESPQQFVSRIKPAEGNVDYELLGDSYLKGYKDYLKEHGIAEPDIDVYANEIKSRFFEGVYGDDDFNKRFVATPDPKVVAQQKQENETAGVGESILSGAARTIEGKTQGTADLITRVIKDNELGGQPLFVSPTLSGEGEWGEDIADWQGNTVGYADQNTKEGLREMFGDAYFGKNQRYRWKTGEDTGSDRTVFEEAFSALPAAADFVGKAKVDNPNAMAEVAGSSITELGLMLMPWTRAASGSTAFPEMAYSGAQDYIKTMEKEQGGVISQDKKALVEDLNGMLAATEFIPLAALSGPARDAWVKNVNSGEALKWLDTVTGGIIKKTLAGAAGETVDEVIQNIGSNLIANNVVAYDADRGTFSGTDDAAAGGALGGAIMGGLIGALGARRSGGQAHGDESEGLPPDGLPPDPMAAAGDEGMEDSLQAARRAEAEKQAAEVGKATADAAAASGRNIASVSTAAIDLNDAGNIDAILTEMGLPPAEHDQQSAEAWGSNKYSNQMQGELEKEIANLERDAERLKDLEGMRDTIARTTGDQDKLRANEKEMRKLSGVSQRLESRREQLARVNADQSSRGGIPVAKSQYSNLFAAAETKYGLPRGMLSTFASIESGFDTNAVSSTNATGLFQFTSGTGKRYGLFPGGRDIRRDPVANTDAAARLARDNIKHLQAAGVPITPFTIYLAHQQGAGGAAELFSAARTGQVSDRLRKNMDLNAGGGLDASQFLTKMQGIFERKAGAAPGSMIPQYDPSKIKPVRTGYDDDIDNDYSSGKAQSESRLKYFEDDTYIPSGSIPAKEPKKPSPFDEYDGLRAELDTMTEESKARKGSWPDWISESSDGFRTVEVEGGKRVTVTPAELKRIVNVAEKEPGKLSQRQSSIIDAMISVAAKRIEAKKPAETNDAQPEAAPEVQQPTAEAAQPETTPAEPTPGTGDTQPAGQADAGQLPPADGTSPAATVGQPAAKDKKPSAFIGKQVRYGTAEGQLFKQDGVLYVRDSSGDIPVESGMSGLSANELGLTVIGNDFPQVQEQRDIAEANRTKTDWGTNTLTVRGKQYSYVSANSNADGITTSITAKRADGTTVSFTDANVIAAIESHKIAYELEQLYDAATQLEAIRAVESDPKILERVAGTGIQPTGNPQKDAGGKAAGGTDAQGIKPSGYKPPTLMTKGGKEKKRQPTQADVDLAIHNLDADIELTSWQQEILNAVFANNLKNGDTREVIAKEPDAVAVDESPIAIDDIITEQDAQNDEALKETEPEPAPEQSPVVDDTNGKIPEPEQPPIEAAQDVQADAQVVTPSVTSNAGGPKVTVKRSKLKPPPPKAKPTAPTLQERQQAVRVYLESLASTDSHPKPADARKWVALLEGLKSGVRFKIGKQVFDPADDYTADLFSTFATIRKGILSGDIMSVYDGSGRVLYGDSPFQQFLTFSPDILNPDVDIIDNGLDQNDLVPLTAKWLLDNIAAKQVNPASVTEEAAGIMDASAPASVAAEPERPVARVGTRVESIISKHKLSRQDADLLRSVYFGNPPKTSAAALAKLRVAVRDAIGAVGDNSRGEMREAMARTVDARAEIESILYEGGNLVTSAVESNVRDDDGLNPEQVYDAISNLKITGMPDISTTIPDEVIAAAADMGIDPEQIRGVWWDGQVHINPAAIKSVQELEAVILEEMAHGRLYSITSDTGYNTAILALYNSMGKDPDGVLGKIAHDNGIDLSEYLAASRTMTDQERGIWLTAEVLAKLPLAKKSLSTRVLSAYKQAVGALREAIRKTGVARLQNVTESDLQYIASRIASAELVDAGTPRLITDLANAPIPVDADGILVAKYEADDDGIIRDLPQFSLRRGTVSTNGNIFDNDVAADQARILINNRFNNRTLPKQSLRMRFDRLSDAGKQLWAESKKEAGTHRDSLRSKAIAAYKRMLFTDAGIGHKGDSAEIRAANRELADSVRSIELEESAVGFALETDAIELESSIISIFGKGSGKLTDAEQKLFSDALRGQHTFSNKDHNTMIAHFRNRIDNASKQLLKRLVEQTDIYLAEIKDPLARRDTLDAMQDIARGIPYDEVYIPQGGHKAVKYYERQVRVRANMGKYVTTSYKMFIDPNWNRKVRMLPEYSAAVTYMQNHMQSKMEAGKVFSQHDAEVYINAMLDEMVMHRNPIAYQQSVDGRKRSEILMRKGDLAPEIRALLGEVNDPLHNYVNTMTGITRYVIGHDFQVRIRTLGLATGLFSLNRGGDDARMTHQYTKSGRDEWSILEDVYMHPETSQQLAAMRQPMFESHKVIEAMIKFSQMSKVSNTVLSPTTALRNVWSGFLLLTAAGNTIINNPKGFVAASKLLMNARSRYSWQGFGNKLIGADSGANQQVYDYIRLGIVRDGATSGELSRIIADMNHLMNYNTTMSSNPLRKVMDVASRFYRYGDDMFKIVHFEAEREMLIKSGMAKEDADREAARRTRDMMPTYTMIPRVIKDLRWIPVISTFPSFPWEVMRTTKNQFIYLGRDIKETRRLRSEGRHDEANVRGTAVIKRIAGMVAADVLLCGTAVYAWNTMFSGVSQEDADAIDEMSGQNQQSHCKLYWQTDEGEVSYTNMSSLIPVESVIAQPFIEGGYAARNAETTAGAVAAGVMTTASGFAEPYLSTDMAFQSMVDVMYNVKGFSGQHVYTEGKTFGDLIGNPVDNFDEISDAVGHLWKTNAPGLLKTTFRDFVVASSHTIDEVNDGDPSIFDEMAAVAGGRVTRDGREFTLPDATIAMAGFRTQTKRISVIARQQSIAVARDLNTATKSFKASVGVTAPLGEDDIMESAARFAVTRKSLYDKMGRTVDYLRKSGMDDGKIISTLYGEGQGTISKQDVEYIVGTGKTPAYRIDDGFMDNAKRAFDNMPQDRKWLAQKNLAVRFDAVRKSIRTAEAELISNP